MFDLCYWCYTFNLSIPEDKVAHRFTKNVYLQNKGLVHEYSTIKIQDVKRAYIHITLLQYINGSSKAITNTKRRLSLYQKLQIWLNGATDQILKDVVKNFGLIPAFLSGNGIRLVDHDRWLQQARYHGNRDRISWWASPQVIVGSDQLFRCNVMCWRHASHLEAASLISLLYKGRPRVRLTIPWQYTWYQDYYSILSA